MGKRKRSIGVDLAPTPRKKKRGWARMQDIQQVNVKMEKQGYEERLRVRARMAGVTPDKQGLAQMKSPMLSEPAGQAIWAAYKGKRDGEGKARALWDVYDRLTAAEARYAAVVLGVNINAKVAKVEFLPEATETRGEEATDDRTEDEKHRAAVNSWMHWKGHLGCLSTSRHTALMDVMRGRKEPIVEGQLTQAGRNFLESLEALKEIVDRK